VPRDKNGNVTDDAQKAAEGKPAPFRLVIGWPSPATASRSASGAGRAGPPTRR
jgi:hypothetical protein